MYTRYIGILLGILALGGVGYYIYYDIVSEPSESAVKTVGEVANKTGDDSAPTVDEDGTIETSNMPAGIEAVHSAGNINIPAPSLERIVINGEVSDVKRAALEKTLRELSAQVASGGKYEQWLELASYRKVSEDYEGAREIWEYMTKRWPGDRAAFVNLGNLYHFYLKDFPRAEEYMLVTLERGDPVANDYIALYELYALSYKEKADQADDILLQGFDRVPNNPEISFTLAEYYAGKGESVKAKTYYDIVLKFAESSGDTALEERILAAIASL